MRQNEHDKDFFKANLPQKWLVAEIKLELALSLHQIILSKIMGERGNASNSEIREPPSRKLILVTQPFPPFLSSGLNATSVL